MYRYLAAVCILCTALLSSCIGDDEERGVLVTSSAPLTHESENRADVSSAALTAENETLWVYVCGAVRAPGVYELEQGSRVFEAVKLAGGLSADAFAEGLNLAETVYDGEQIFVPDKSEALPDAVLSSSRSGRININTAGRDELMQLPGIGEAKADAVIAFRKKHGAFQSTEEITRVPGIGDSLYERLMDLITV